MFRAPTERTQQVTVYPSSAMEPKKEEVEMHHQPRQFQDYSAVFKSPPPYTSQSNYPQAQPYGIRYQGSYPGPYQGQNWGPTQGAAQGPYQGAAQGLHQGPAQGLHQGPAQGLHQGPAQGLHQGPPQGPYQGLYQGPHQGAHQGAYQDPHASQQVFTVQPTVFVGTNDQASVYPDHMCYSVFTMLCCCLPLGIAAVVCSCITQDANVAGKSEEAKNSSRAAFILNNVALGLGIVVIIAATVTVVFVYKPWE
ncbi:hypothetical protein NFI96_018619 [Prochilodus magdalenae]|nr:hypothetical protein NFI96_018619 [Prochilodus magdalenae]